jgi:predicted transglutaminase-like cysteine proteinase
MRSSSGAEFARVVAIMGGAALLGSQSVQAAAPVAFAPWDASEPIFEQRAVSLDDESVSNADFMQLGPAAPAPLGFLGFCARRPEQCGISDLSDQAGAGLNLEQRTRQLYGEYYWRVAFSNAATRRFGLGSGLDETPTVGAPTHHAHKYAAPSVWRPDASALADDKSRAYQPEAPPEFGFSPMGAPPPLVMTPALMAILGRVNAQVNHAIRYVADDVQYGTKDFWTLPLDPGGTAEGDCKDYVLEKRRALIELGAPSDDLAIAIVRTPWHETHAVLLVDTDRGEMVLDSLSSWVKPWREVHYTWIERQAPGKQLAWVKVVGPRA